MQERQRHFLPDEAFAKLMNARGSSVVPPPEGTLKVVAPAMPCCALREAYGADSPPGFSHTPAHLIANAAPPTSHLTSPHSQIIHVATQSHTILPIVDTTMPPRNRCT
jgi:hypothetical protein